ncbi:MAG: hypothetical protein HW403_1075 [Dehalococcoidia bacterium]|nr:hypothetical protein [Dehalococcoidia bacterium]
MPEALPRRIRTVPPLAIDLVTTRPKALGGGLITSVAPGSIGEAIGLKAGDLLVSINGHVLRDVIDYRFYGAEERLRLEVDRGGERTYLDVEKDPDESLGVDFGAVLFEEIERCNNGCFFCFINGLHKGMRRTLYIKDDDYRLSFLYGGFITLTNLDEADWERIQEQRLTPLYVSVHSTEPVLRRQLLSNTKAPEVLPQIQRLGAMGTQVHTQIVLCPGINDGSHLDRSIEDLAALYPTVRSIAVVPVGITETGRELALRRRRSYGPKEAAPWNSGRARTVLAQIKSWQRRFRRDMGLTYVYPSDEFYLMAGTPVPSVSRYDGFPQYENGVGMVRDLLSDWAKLKSRWQRGGSARFSPEAPERITIACGTLVYSVMAKIVEEMNRLGPITADLVAVENRFFGEAITCSGLLTGGDIVAGLRGRSLGDVVALSRQILDIDGEVFLDDMTPSQVESELGRPLVFARDFSELVGALSQKNATIKG